MARFLPIQLSETLFVIALMFDYRLSSVNASGADGTGLARAVTEAPRRMR
jgi:hypothetical protein